MDYRALNQLAFIEFIFSNETLLCAIAAVIGKQNRKKNESPYSVKTSG